MEIRQLQSLIKLVECNFSVSKAVDKMFLVRSAVSQHLKKLEQELGAELFVRRGKRLTGLTHMFMDLPGARLLTILLLRPA